MTPDPVPRVPGFPTPPSDRTAGGRAARAAVPRGDLAVHDPGPDRPDPVDLLEGQGRTRLPDLLPIRYGRMAASAFAFFRGAPLVMAHDLAAGPDIGIEVQLCGDAHLSNFGIFGTPERRLVFDINDFDETARGPFEWDVKRLAASLEIAGRDRGFPTEARAAAVSAAARAYRHAMRDLAGLGNLDVWYTSFDVDRLADDPTVHPAMRRVLRRQVTKARRKDNRHAYARLVRQTPDGPRIEAAPPLVVPIEDLAGHDEATHLTEGLSGLLDGYAATLSADRRQLLRSYRPVHLARKVVGVGSVGTRCWIALLLGRDPDDPLMLQVKQAQESVVAQVTTPSPYAHQGERIVAGQKTMQAASDAFLGWHRVERGLDGLAHDFYVRQLRDWKGSVDVAGLTPPMERAYAALCGRALARAHARTGDRLAIAGYLGSGTDFDHAMVDFAAAYADQNDRDLALLRSAIETGRVTAVPGV